MARPTIDNIWGSSGTATDPGDAKVNTGWAAEIPPFETQNFWQKRVDELLQNLERNGFMEWDAATPYRIGSWALASDNEIYRSITASNSGNDPIGSPANWTSLADLITVIQATETTKGIAEIATLAETQAGTDDTRIVTPKKLKDAIQVVVPDASTSTKGKIQLTTNAEAQTGTNATKAITPATLASVTATDTRKGLVEKATDAEITSATDTSRFTTPKQLTDRINVLVPTASTTAQGKVERATDGEVTTGTDTTRYVSPKQVKDKINALVPAASTSVAGKVERATDAEVTTGTDTTRYVSPKQVKDKINALATPSASETVQGKVERATAAEATTGTDTTRYITPKQLKDKVDAIPATGANTSLSNLATAGKERIITAWANFNGTFGTQAPIDGSGVSSVGDVGTGIHQLNFSPTLANATYGFAGTAQSNANLVLTRRLGGDKLTTKLQIDVTNALSGNVDSSEITVCIFGG